MDEINGLSEAEQADKIFFDYLIKAYGVFLEGTDDFDGMDQALVANFDKKNEEIIREVEKLKKELAVLEREWSSLSESESPLTLLEREKSILQTDKEKFQSYISHLETKKMKLSETVEVLKQDILQSEKAIEQLYQDKQTLSDTVDAQELSPTDVDRMNAERDQLVQSLESTRNHLDEINKKVWNGEITLQKTMDRLERSVQEFNAHLYKLDLSDLQGSEFASLKQELELNVNVPTKHQMISMDLIRDFKPACNAYIVHQKKKTHELQEKIFVLQEKLDNISWNLIQKQEQLAVLANSVENCNARYQDQKQVFVFM